MADKIQERLAVCEFPHSWKLREQLGPSTKRTKESTALLLEDSSFSRNELPFHSLMGSVALAYEYFLSDDVARALEILHDGEGKLQALAENALNPAISHVIKATKVAFLLRTGNINQAAKIVSSIQEVSTMDNRNRVALRFGFPALFVGSFDSPGAMELALDLLSKAIDGECTESVWYYTKAVFMGRLDRGVRLIEKMPSDEEFHLLEKALDLERKAIYTSYSGNLHRQSAKELSRPVRILGSRGKGDELKIRQFNKKSYELYRESIQLNPDCPETTFRCARGFILLPPPCRDLPLAKKLLDRAMALAPGSRFGHQVMAEFLKADDPREAIKYYELCERKRMYGATMARIRLEYQTGYLEDGIKRLEGLLHVYQEDVERIQILNELTTFSILILKDIRKACGYAERMLEYGRVADFAMQCRPSGAFFMKRFSRITLYELLVDELKRLPADGATDEERRYFVRFEERLSSRKIAPTELMERKGKPDTFCRASSCNLSFRQIESDGGWRRKATPLGVSSPPVLSWRRRR